jgi:carbon monoxide dehydrogenase subunit G
VQTTVAAPADAVWAVVGDFDGIDKLFPALEGLRIEDGPDGHDRVLTMFGMDIRERFISKDDDARVLVYSVLSIPGVDLAHHQGTVSVAEVDGGTEVTWAFDVEPDAMVDLFKGTYAGALADLEKYFA